MLKKSDFQEAFSAVRESTSHRDYNLPDDYYEILSTADFAPLGGDEVRILAWGIMIGMELEKSDPE